MPLPDAVTLPKLVFSEVLLAGLLVLLGARLWHGGAGLRRTVADVPIALFAGSAIAATLLGIAPLLSVSGTPLRQDGLVSLLLYALLAWITAQLVTSADGARRVQLAIVVGAYAASILALLEVARSAADTVGAGETAFTFAGLARAAGPLGNPNTLGALLALSIPLAIAALIASTDGATRVAMGNVVVVLVLALALTFSRSAWIGALVGVAVVVAPVLRAAPRRTVGVAVAAALGLAALVGLAGLTEVPIATAVTSRATALADPAGSFGTRLRIWGEAVDVVRARPLLGVGPGAFGLAYPEVQRGDWTGGALVDKAHAEPLDVAATQGILGLAAYAWTLGVILRVAASRGSGPASTGALGGLVGYLASLAVNFTALPAAVPFWILAGTVLGALPREGSGIAPRPAAVAAAAVAVLLATNAIRTVAAEVSYGDVAGGATAVERALALAPERTDYAELAGDLARERGDLPAAVARYEHAARVGTARPTLHWKLALSYDELGMRAQAVRAAEVAVRMHPFDPRNEALLCQLRIACQ